MNTIQIKNRKIGDGYPAYIIAEMSANHSGSIERAKEIIRAAKESGADCVKIQTYTPDTLTIDCHNQYFQIENGTWEGENLYSLYGKAYTPWEWHKELKEEADRIGIDFFSTPFDTTSVDFLEELGVDFYKIASFEMIDLPLLRYIASKGKPIIMSTGMGTKEEIKEALEAIYEMGNDQVAILKCSSAYPAISDDMHLRTIADMKKEFDIPVGLSDHSMGHLGATTAVALGANVIEKHFCISRDIENPDASFSMEPAEFKEMVEQVRQVEKAMGNVFYGVSSQEESSKSFRRSVFVVKDLKKGDVITAEHVRVIRPGYGEKPKYMDDIVGMKVGCNVEWGNPFTFDILCKNSILFLTDDKNTEIPYEIAKEYDGHEVYRIGNKVTLDLVQKMQPAIIVCQKYKHGIPEDVVEFMNGRVVELN
ncbi:MAG: pseudaminic acid synthase [Lachnospiraceae bacterium]|nr:pseudaminic acid synthase [Lachnospiraceae bacterium]